MVRVQRICLIIFTPVMAGNIDDIKSPYTRHDTTCSRLRFISTSVLSLQRSGGQYYWYHIAIYTRWYARYNLQSATIHLKPHSLLSPDAMGGNINDIISQYTRGDTPCTTCSWLRFISNLTPCSLQTLWGAILMISYRNIHEVIRPVQLAAGYD